MTFIYIYYVYVYIIHIIHVNINTRSSVFEWLEDCWDDAASRGASDPPVAAMAARQHVFLTRSG